MLQCDWLSCLILSSIVIHQISSLARDWFKCVTWLNMPRVVKNIGGIINKIVPNWLTVYARMFILEHYLSLEAYTSLSEHCSLLGIDNARLAYGRCAN